MDDTDAAVDDLLYITDVQLNDGSVCLPYAQISFEEDLKKCMRYWAKSYNYNVAVATTGTNAYYGAVNYMTIQTAAPGNGLCVPFKVRMRASPSTTIYSWSTGTQSKASVGSAGDKSGNLELIGENSFCIYLTETVPFVGTWISCEATQC